MKNQFSISEFPRIGESEVSHRFQGGGDNGQLIGCDQKIDILGEAGLHMESHGNAANQGIWNLFLFKTSGQLLELGEDVHAAYPLTAPSVRPLTKSFMEKVKRMMTGMEAMA